jgi:hypothetical protein
MVFAAGERRGEDAMTIKQRIQSMLERLDDDTPVEVIIDKIFLIKDIEEAIQEADAGLGTEHDELVAELMADWRGS